MYCNNFKLHMHSGFDLSHQLALRRHVWSLVPYQMAAIAVRSAKGCRGLFPLSKKVVHGAERYHVWEGAKVVILSQSLRGRHGGSGCDIWYRADLDTTYTTQLKILTIRFTFFKLYTWHLYNNGNSNFINCVQAHNALACQRV
jgi:hypothetical protein